MSESPPILELFSLRGRRVLVTGAGRGLGRGMALAAAGAGAAVAGVARSGEELDETAELAHGLPGSFDPLVADLSQIEDLDALVERAETAGPLDGIVHAAGTQLRRDAVDLSVEEWRSVQRVNLEAPFFLSTALARRQLSAGRSGSHVFVGSLGTSLGIRRIAPYVASKSALIGVVRTLALEWASAGIRANAVAPGYFETKLTSDLLSDPQQRARVLSRIAMDRLGTPDDLAGAVVFLLSDASAYVTGQLLNVDGGWLAG